LTRPKLPESLSCQAEASHLFFTLLKFDFTDFLVHKSLFANSLLIRSSRKHIVNGKAAEQQLCAACEAVKKRKERLYSAKVRLAKCNQHI